MKVVITITPSDELADPSDSTGLTEAAYMELMDALMSFGEIDNIEREES